MEFVNKISKIDFQQKQTSLDILKDYMYFNGITIIEYDDFVFNAGANNEPHLHVFLFKQNDEEFVSNEEVSRKLGPNYISPWSQLIFEADIRNAKDRILERRKNNLIDRTTVKTAFYQNRAFCTYARNILLLGNIFIYLLKSNSIAQASEQNEFSSSARDSVLPSTSNINGKFLLKVNIILNIILKFL